MILFLFCYVLFFVLGYILKHILNNITHLSRLFVSIIKKLVFFFFLRLHLQQFEPNFLLLLLFGLLSLSLHLFIFFCFPINFSSFLLRSATMIKCPYFCFFFVLNFIFYFCFASILGYLLNTGKILIKVLVDVSFVFSDEKCKIFFIKTLSILIVIANVFWLNFSCSCSLKQPLMSY